MVRDEFRCPQTAEAANLDDALAILRSLNTAPPESTRLAPDLHPPAPPHALAMARYGGLIAARVSRHAEQQWRAFWDHAQEHGVLAALPPLAPTVVFDLLFDTAMHPEHVLLDVRTACSFAAERIPNSLNVPYGDDAHAFVARARSSGMRPTGAGSLIILAGEDDAAARAAADALRQAGFPNITQLDGGLAAWRGLGLATVCDFALKAHREEAARYLRTRAWS